MMGEPSASLPMNGSSIRVEVAVERAHLAISEASLIVWRAPRSFLIFTP